MLLQRNENETIRNEAIRIEHVKVKSYLPVILHPNFNSFRPCAIITVNAGQAREIVTEVEVYAQAWSSEQVSVFVGPNPALMLPDEIQQFNFSFKKDFEYTSYNLKNAIPLNAALYLGPLI